MKTLIIHPNDNSTDFLAKSYSDLDCTLITDNYYGRSKLKELIKKHDRVIMMGHGSPSGLYTADYNTIIDSSLVYLLRDKICVCIWCYANEFFNKYELKGYATGMIISEVEEAYDLGVKCTSMEVSDSNKLFTDSLKIALKEDLISESMKENYIGDSEIIKFNKNSL